MNANEKRHRGQTYDAVVIGGGAAGLSGAMILGRSRRSVAVVDAGHPRNAPAAAVHGLLGHDGTPPDDLLAKGRREVRRYGGEIVDGEVVGVLRDGSGFLVGLADGGRLRARRLLVATGLVDELPEIPGLREHWGSGVVHCPYCHGWEVRDRAIAVLALGPLSIHQALLFRQLSEDVVLLRNGVELPEDGLAKLAARGIEVIDGEVAAVQGAERVTGVRLADGRVVAVEAVAAGGRMVARAGFLTDLGLTAVEHPSGMGQHLAVDATGRTDIDGVWAAGNVADLGAQVGAAASAGVVAAAQINLDLVEELVEEEVRQAQARPVT